MNGGPIVKTTSLGTTISSTSFTQAYSGLQPPKAGEYFVLTDPSTPIRSGADLAAINSADDAGELGTELRFGNPMKVVDVGKSYSAVELPEDPPENRSS